MLALCFGVAVIKVFVLEDAPSQEDALAIDGDEAELEVYEAEADVLSEKIIDWIVEEDMDRVMSHFPQYVMSDKAVRRTRSYMKEQRYLLEEQDWKTDAGRTYTDNVKIDDGLDFAFESGGSPILYDVEKVASRPDDPRTLTLEFRWGVLETPSGEKKLALINFSAKKQTMHTVDTSESDNEAVRRSDSAKLYKNGWAPYENRAKPDLKSAVEFFNEYIGHLRQGQLDEAYAQTHPAFKEMLPRTKYEKAAASLTEAVGEPGSLTLKSISAKPASTEHIWKDKSYVPVLITAMYTPSNAQGNEKLRVELSLQRRFDFRTTPPTPLETTGLIGQLVHR
jgi:hypothetical protein